MSSTVTPHAPARGEALARPAQDTVAFADPPTLGRRQVLTADHVSAAAYDESQKRNPISKM